MLGKRIISQIDLKAMVTEIYPNMRDSLVLTLLGKHTQWCNPEHKTFAEIRFDNFHNKLKYEKYVLSLMHIS